MPGHPSHHPPIDLIKPAFINEIASASLPLLVVVAPTGSGKSTRLPLWLAETTQASPNTRSQVLVVEPRRVACRALATYLAELRGEAVGQSVGYQVRFESKQSGETRILFVTPGIALRLLSSASTWSACLVDEFHERHWEVDLLVTLLLQRRQDAPEAAPALVLTSATIEGKALASTMGAQILEAEGRSYPVSVSYLDGPSAPGIQGLEERVVTAVTATLRQSPDAKEDILVFLPGKGEIESCLRALTPVIASDKVALLPVHGSLPMAQLAKAFAPDAPVRRVYLSTNVAETSLTLPRVTTVIDAGLVRMRMHRGGRSALSLVPVTQSQMIQRTGRAGRVAPGHCIRLWNEGFLPSQDIRPEVERIELDDLVLQAAEHGLAGERLLSAPWISMPPQFAIDTARSRLQGIAALDADFALTAFGKDLASWPLSALEASLVVGAPEALAATLADLAALLQQHGSLLLSLSAHTSDRREAIVEARRALLDACLDDVFSALVLLRHGDPVRHGLHRSGLQQARSIASQLRRKMHLAVTSPVDDQSPLPDPEALAAWLLSRAPALGFVRRKRADAKPKGRGPRRGPVNPSEPWANGEMELMVMPFASTNPEQQLRTPKAGVILSHTWIGGSGLRVQGRGQMLLPCRLEVLADAGLGEQEIQAPRRDKQSRKMRIIADVTTTLAGVTLQTAQQALSGQALRKAIAAMMVEGRFWQPQMAAVLDTLHLLQLLSDWPTPKEWGACPDARAWAQDPVAYLQERLTTLGLESAEELELLGTEDLVPDITGLLGVDAYTITEFERDFPRMWEFKGAVYQCSVFPLRGKVCLEPHNKQAKQANDPGAQFVPRFRGFQVDYQKASRIVRLR